MNRSDKNRAICRLAQILTTALTEDGITQAEDVKDAVELIKQVDEKFARVSLVPQLANLSASNKALLKEGADE